MVRTGLSQYYTYLERCAPIPTLPHADDRALPDVNAILSSFGADVVQLRDMALNRLILYPFPDLKVVLHTVPNER